MIRGGRGLGISAQELSSIKVPVCSIVGDKDPFLSKAQAISGKVPNHTLIIIEGADHITTITSKKAKDGLVNFLKRNS
jgi:pimeloyl-ACP methyl ester carboxylesterase